MGKKIYFTESQLNAIVKKTLRESLSNENSDISIVWDKIINYHIATQEELSLVSYIHGYSVETLNEVIYARTGYHDMDQYESVDQQEEENEDEDI